MTLEEAKDFARALSLALEQGEENRAENEQYIRELNSYHYEYTWKLVKPAEGNESIFAIEVYLP